MIAFPGRRSRTELVGAAPRFTPPDPMEAEASFFRSCGIGKPHLARATEDAERNGTTIEAELIAARHIRPDIYYRWLAERLGLHFFERIDPKSVLTPASIDILLVRDGPLRVNDRNRILTVIVPSARTLSDEQQRLSRQPELRSRLAVASPASIRAAVWAANETARARLTTSALDERYREMSARTVLTGTQGFALALTFCALIAAFVTSPTPALVLTHIVLTLLFLSSSLLRLCAAALGKRPPPPVLPHLDKLPIYTVLVALKDEEVVVGQLVRSLHRLDWPKSRLDIKFICEQDDLKTMRALRAANPGPHCEIVRVPALGPKTKPKALSYAMAGAKGDYVVLYDAEDIPAPGQLREAYGIFRTSDGRTGCVQSPLVIANYRKNWVTALFAIEYAGLFRSLIPFMGRFGLPVPLGGTSNHFPRKVLEEVGGWDPYNVTEDADLGMRLYRAGYRTVAAYHATIETAPETLTVWTRQRTRWLKGWAQTWLILMRSPWRTLSEMGPYGFMASQVLIAGMLLSTLAHPLMYVLIGNYLANSALGTFSAHEPLHSGLFILDVASVASSYIAFAVMGLMHMTAREQQRIAPRHLAMLPVYWLAMAWASWIAMVELRRKPHHWAKTPHKAYEPAAGQERPTEIQTD
ncbi:glycosyltransferase [Pseudohoeflea suaedae]|nr:glycosyltransferase [Pseudohoeflea suaedae]